MGTVSKRSSSRHPHLQQPQQQASHRPHSAMGGPVHNGTGSSPPSARETFLNYFFGQNGPGPIPGSSVDRSHNLGHGHGHGHGSQSIIPVGRDLSGAEASMSSGLMAGKRSLDGNNAAYDMKSLGKHIEAVSAPYNMVLVPSLLIFVPAARVWRVLTRFRLTGPTLLFGKRWRLR